MSDPDSILGQMIIRVVRSLARLWVLGLVLAAAAILLAPWWWVGECAGHWHLHLLVLAVIPALIVRRWWLGAVLAAAAVFVAPLLVFDPPAVEGPAAAIQPLRVVTANVGWFNDRHAELEVALSSPLPDVLGVVELTPALAERLRPLLPHRYELVGPGLGAFGSGIYSRLPIQVARAHRLGNTEILDVTLRGEHGPLRLLLVHPPPPVGSKGFRERNELFLGVAELAAAAREPVVVMGDFNCSPASPAWPRLLHHGELRPADDLPRSWPAPVAPLGIAIDHILTGPGLAIDGLHPIDLPGSDHRGLSAVIRAGP